MTHLFVTNDFPPKIGGIQTMLWELWRRLDPSTFAVLTTAYEGATAWDAEQPFRIERVPDKVLLPTPGLAARIDALAVEIGASRIVLDPALPLGLVGARLRAAPYVVVIHGAEVTVPGRLPAAAGLLGRVLRGADLVIAGGGYPAAEARRAAGGALPMTIVPPGVDVDRFRPLDDERRRRARDHFGLPQDAPLVVSISRLVPRKGMDVLISAAALLAPEHPGLAVAIGGTGRDRKRLQRLVIETGAPVHLLGRIEHDDLPLLYGCGDVFAMLCRNRWGGLEQEGFGIVFAEAAAAGVPQVAGDSGGAAEAVEDGVTGLVVRYPEDAVSVAAAIGRLLAEPDTRARMAAAGRARVEAELSWDVLAARLAGALGDEGP
jgi:phosphatidyl-myo-inositol dimannoside synthase